MEYCFRFPNDRMKAVWGRKSVRALALLALIVVWAAPADAQKRAKAGQHAKVQHSKLDNELNRVADGIGDSDVIVEFFDDADGSTRIKAAGGLSGRKLGNIRARAGRMPNALLKRLADDPNVKRVHLDREAEALVARASATIGATTARAQYGYSGAGIGVAVIDSGITPNHLDLSIANGKGQRVVAFVDFVNGRTTKYDDWGHGTHVAGIVAGNGYESRGTREAVAPQANIVALKALNGTGKGRISYIIAALDWAVAHKAQYNIRVINMSLGAGVFESYLTDPLTLAAKHAVDNGIVVVAAAGNLGKAANGNPQYGAITAPGNAPWVLTVGASSTMGTTDRRDDTIALYSSRGPTMIDFMSKPDLVAPGTGIVSLSAPNSLL